MKSSILSVNSILYGGDYNPEQWNRSVWDEDIRLMKQAGVNIVTVGVFSWSRLEPVEGEFDFTWMDELLDLLHQNKIKVCLATATATPPVWLVRKHPEILPVTKTGVRLDHGSRQHFTPHSLVFRDYVKRLVSALGERYHKHPALLLWHIGNEPACHMQASYGDVDKLAFQEWLKNRYESIENLNTAWTTDFWGQRYRLFGEIHPPRKATYDLNPTMELDYKRFMSDGWRDLYRIESRILHSFDPSIPQTVNFIGLFPSIDQFSWADDIDIASWDAYPDPREHPYGFAEGHDLTRSIKKGAPFLLLEQSASFVQWRDFNDLRRPGVLRTQSFQALARGADGVMYFQWRQSKGGGERFHGAMLPHAGESTRVFSEVTRLGEDLKKLDEIVGSCVDSKVALLFDWNTWWAWNHATIPWKHLDYVEVFKAVYQAFWGLNITVDIVPPSANLSRYDWVVASSLFLISEGDCQSLKDYVEKGGNLLASALTGVVDEHNQVVLGGYPGYLRGLFGVTVEEWINYPLGVEENSISGATISSLGVSGIAESIRTEGANVLAKFEKDFVKTQPALTQNSYGKGQAYYLGTQLTAENWKRLLLGINDKFSVNTLPDGIEKVVRTNDDGRQFVFLINHCNKPSPFFEWLEGQGEDLLNNELIDNGKMSIEAYGVRVIRLVL